MTVKEIRLSAGMTQKAFAEYFDIPKRSIENWEGDQRKCPAYLLALMEYKLKKEGLIDAPSDNRSTKSTPEE